MTETPPPDAFRAFYDAVRENADMLGAGWIRSLSFEQFADAGFDSRDHSVAFFDQDYYRNQLPDAWQGEANLYLHFCRLGGRLGLKPNAIVDYDFLQRQLVGSGSGGFRLGGAGAPAERDNVGLVALYLRRIADRRLSPHPLFDPAFYAVSADLGDSDIPVLHFLAQGAGRPFSPYFSIAFYELQAPELRGAAMNHLAHYADAAAGGRRDANPMLHGAFYAARLGDDSVDPLAHFVTDGADLGLRPNPYTDMDFASGSLDLDRLGVGAALRRYIAVA